MFSFLFKKGIDKKFNAVHSSIKSSFSNIHNDMSKVTQWISHFKSQHDLHTQNFENQEQTLQNILERLEEIEARLESTFFVSEDEPENGNIEISISDEKRWKKLTDIQHHLVHANFTNIFKPLLKISKK